jgi:hypothetical protein
MSADAVWGTSTPAGSWDTALSAIVSKLRAALRACDASVSTAAGCYQLTLPSNAWVDIEDARRALDEAEGYVRAVRFVRFGNAWGPSNVAASIAARPLLAGVDAGWIARARSGLRDVRVRVLADGGNRAEALRACASCRDLLAKELGVAPSKETEAVVKGLRTEHLSG